MELVVDVLGTLVVLMLYNHWMEKISFVDVMKLNFLPMLKKNSGLQESGSSWYGVMIFTKHHFIIFGNYIAIFFYINEFLCVLCLYMCETKLNLESRSNARAFN
jgi:hypothetical protein